MNVECVKSTTVADFRVDGGVALSQIPGAMAKPDISIDQFIAGSLAEGAISWPGRWSTPKANSAFVERSIDHGVAGMLFELAVNSDWPARVIDGLRDQALAQTMWEVRHRQVVGRLLTGLAQVDVTPMLLKGTAAAYDLYETPAMRARIDTDILVDIGDLAAARLVLARNGFNRGSQERDDNDEFSLQETWYFTTEDGVNNCHTIDLHWHVMNSMALRQTLDYADSVRSARPLPRLHPHAIGMDLPRALIHVCLHRAIQDPRPYHIEGRRFFAGDRLIWANDIHLIAGALDGDGWERFGAIVAEKRLSSVCVDGLEFARKSLGTIVPKSVLDDLSLRRPDSRESRYLMNSSQLTRAFQDVLAVKGLSAKAGYVLDRLLVRKDFLRSKYPNMDKSSIAVLYLKRLAHLLHRRANRSDVL